MSAGIVELARMLYCPSYKRSESGERSLERSGRRASTSQSIASHHHPCIPPSLRRLICDACGTMRDQSVHITLPQSACGQCVSPAVLASCWSAHHVHAPRCYCSSRLCAGVRWAKAGPMAYSVLRARHVSGNTHGMCVGGHLDHSRVAQKATLV